MSEDFSSLNSFLFIKQMFVCFSYYETSIQKAFFCYHEQVKSYNELWFQNSLLKFVWCVNEQSHHALLCLNEFAYTILSMLIGHV